MSSERRQFARVLRQQPTRAEEILWAQLRGSRFHGAKFRRQFPFDRYVVDFYCHAAKLAVELDGKQHEWFAHYDAGRTEIIESRAFASCASPMPRFAMTSIPCWREFTRNSVCPSVERRVPSPLPLSRRERGTHASQPYPAAARLLAAPRPANPSPAKPRRIIAQVEGSGAATNSRPCTETPVSSVCSTTPVTGFTVATSSTPPKSPSAMIGVLGSSPVRLSA